ncbi:DUF4232 domain-containing protein [Microbacterium sp. CFH 90308]|uniref:DUF4232 domain-containing protein n=1 Tax=Microbacterium salsuginis TaxID=2722803 RepID=A0ABX1KAR7_9MICO|nr:DUF4232 domain-containing protein [Microbacterium sp. CFH 90308]NLP83139.1 DUF4232 domain-containing protein [Microbacterium sp. CFH 90308]
MNEPSGRRRALSSVVAGALWLVVAGVAWALRQLPGGLPQLASLVPDILPPTVWTWPAAWPAVLAVLSGAAIVVCHALFASLAGRGAAAPGVISPWFAAVAAGAIVGLALDIAVAWSSLSMFGPRGLLGGDFGAAAASGALWGVAAGWMPGLIVARGTARGAAAAGPPERRPWVWAAAAASVVVVLIAGIAGDDARRLDIEAQVEAARQAQAETSFGAPPDPNAEGVPVPAEAEASVPDDPQWCTAERATLLLGGSDAATGHRGQAVQLMNFSEEPCVIEGYPDVAFGDQNNHLLDVTIEHGGSFMTQDFGAQRIEVPAGGYAVAYLGWDAASTHGALITASLHAAAVPGMTRGSWPVELDIVEGSTVAVTAWQPDDGAALGGSGQ